MEISPQSIRSVDFRSTKKGYDPDEVDAFKDQVATLLEEAQQQAATMEARARAAIAKLQELAQQPAAAVAATPTASGDSEVISRTLVLAQRTADAAIAEARAEADTILQAARDEAVRSVDAARHAATKVADEARVEARRSMEDERVRAENEVQSLLARRDFLLGDVDQLEQYIELQRERMREVAAVLHDLAERVPGGLGEMRRPLMSASASAHTIADAYREPAPAAAPVSLPEVLPVTPVEPVVEPIAAVASTAPTAPIAPAASSSVLKPLSPVSADRDDVWRLLDDTGEVPVVQQLPTLQQQLQTGLFQPEEITSELPIIGGDDLR